MDLPLRHNTRGIVRRLTAENGPALWAARTLNTVLGGARAALDAGQKARLKEHLERLERERAEAAESAAAPAASSGRKRGRGSGRGRGGTVN